MRSPPITPRRSEKIVTAPDTYEDLEDIEFGGPGTYRIVVQGALSEEWSDRLAGLSITVVTRAGSSPRSHLTGPIRDQAELRGVLESLYELHLSILEVERIRGECRDAG